MDRRQQKTRDAIFSAFSSLLQRKSFNSITVQDIIEEANIGRSTFYAHFETKDALLNALCTDMFDHVFDEQIPSEETHDFSGNDKSLAPHLTHLLYHLKEDKHGSIRALCGENNELFMSIFKSYLVEMFEKYRSCFPGTIPVDFMLNHLSSSFAEAVRWWFVREQAEQPEKVTDYYLTVLKLETIPSKSV